MKTIAAVLMFALAGPYTLRAGDSDDWPTRMHDIRRGGVSGVKLSPPLSQAWVYTTSRQPAPAWPQSPAIHDYFHSIYNMKPRQGFDRCFDVAVVGGHVYFGSSVSGAVTCLDNGAGGRVRWTFFTDGPVRFAPHVTNGKVYFGSDDGYVYCLNASDGSLVWKERAGPSDEMIWGNEHMISVWPVRTSVIVDDGAVYWAAGLFPREGMYLCKRNAIDGTGGWTTKPKAPPQGYLLASPSALYVSTGKTVPYMYSRENGASLGMIRNTTRYGKYAGGTWALLTPDSKGFWSGPATAGGVQMFEASSRKFIASLKANYVIVSGEFVYGCTPSSLIKIRRSDRKQVWSKPHVYPHALIRAGDYLYAGGEGEVAAFNENGDKIWTARVEGKVYGLAVAQKSLFVSTDKGSIYSFTVKK